MKTRTNLLVLLVYAIIQFSCAEQTTIDVEKPAEENESPPQELSEPTPILPDTPVPTSAPTDPPDPSPNTQPLYFDDFSNPDSGWEHYNEGEGILDYQEGGYRMRIPAIGNQYWVNYGQEFSDIRLEVEAAKIGGPDNNQFGLMCRLELNTFTYYGFLITSEGFYGIMKKTDEGEIQYLGIGAPQYSEVIRLGESTNHIRADCIGNTLTLYVNGEKLIEVQDDSILSGDVGMIVGTINEPGTDILFDNFTLIEP